ncbi:MAG: hypothetical protein JRF65_03450, partial [Deltaproteobacteria bacterium]|nr:hypothetical protein [Deltaproteobacteria bacterium]
MNQSDLENTLHHLNYRANVTALAQWMGQKSPFAAYEIYEGFEEFLDLGTWARFSEIEDDMARTRLSHAFIDHYVQKILMPHETEMRTWMRGASAHVDGRKIYFHEIIPWCQKSSTYENRRVLQKETGPLCKFLKPFALNYWNILLEVLRKDFRFDGYVDYCKRKKGIDYHAYYGRMERLLKDTDDLYFASMEQWSRKRFGRTLGELTRFDAINLLGLGEFDKYLPPHSLQDLTRYFLQWGMDPENTPGLNLEIGSEAGKSAQAMSFILQVPEEVYVLMKPAGGCIDLETLWHELGHGFSAVYTSPDLSVVERDMATSFNLSETFAFLLQGVALSEPFLIRHVGLKPGEAEELAYYKVLKDFSVFRRYAAKFMAEYEMFSSGDLTSGERYAELMTGFTGFTYQPESHLFDLVPEFYCMDYVLGWMGEAKMERHLRTLYGPDWMFEGDVGPLLKAWWA